MTLNRRYALCCRKDASFGAHHKKLNELKLDPYYQRQTCRRMTSFWQYKVYADIRGGSLGMGRQVTAGLTGVVENGNFQRFRWLFRKL